MGRAWNGSGLPPSRIGRRLALAAALLISACGAGAGGPEADPMAGATLRLSVAAGDVVAVRYLVDCAGGTAVDVVVSLEEEGLPRHVDAGLAGAAFADLLVVAPEGSCAVEVRAMASMTEELDGCTPASVIVDVLPEQTTEVLLVIPCAVAGPGAVDAVVVVDHLPQVVKLVVDPATTVKVCTEVTVLPETKDADGDAVTVSFEVVPPDAAAAWTEVGEVDRVRFVPAAPGAWEVVVTADDGLGTTDASVVIQVDGDPAVCS